MPKKVYFLGGYTAIFFYSEMASLRLIFFVKCDILR